MTFGQFASALGGALFLVLLATAPFDAGNYSINGEPVSGPEFLRRAGVVFGLVGTLLLAIAWGWLLIVTLGLFAANLLSASVAVRSRSPAT